MKLVSVTLKNFRCYHDEKTIDIGNLTTIIGVNDIGKSTILEALEIFFNNATVKIDSGDCSVSAADQTVKITCEFADLPDSLVLDAQAETSLQAEYLVTRNGTLRVKKAFKCSTAKPKEEVFVIAYHPTIELYKDLLTLTNTALKARLRQLGINHAGVQLNNNPSIRQAIWAACPNLELQDSEISVAKEDSKRIWDKIYEYLPMYALFQSDRASKNSNSEVQDPMKLAITTALAEPDIKSKLDEIVEAVRSKAVELAQRTHRALSRIDPNLASQLNPEFKAEPKWSGLFSVGLNSDDNIPVNKRGSGVRQLILVSFFRAEAERRLAENPTRSIIYAIEEPETSQHPNNQKILLEAFEELSCEQGCQVILTTHSSGFAALLPIDCFRLITKGEDGQPKIMSCINNTWELIIASLGVVPDNRVCVFVCVEGPSDVSALKHLSHALHIQDQTIPDLSTDPRVAFIVLGGQTLVYWVNERYLKEIGRPEIHIYDNDVARYKAIIDQVNNFGNGSWGVLTHKREIENYLHQDAIQEGLSIAVNINDTDDIPALVGAIANWNAKNAKHKLANYAFPKMTAERIRQRDLQGEVEGWFRRIGAML